VLNAHSLLEMKGIVMKIAAASVAQATNSIQTAMRGSNTPINQGWNEIVSRISQLTTQGLKQSQVGPNQIDQLSGLLKLQVDVTRYQLRVELVSKVSESAVASIRKLQQNQ
jgi:hypothetical protein